MIPIDPRYRVHGDRIVFTGGGSASVGYPIIEVVPFDELVVILVHHPDLKVIYNENVFGVAYDGRILWQIEKRDYPHKHHPFTGIERRGDHLWAYNFRGVEAIVDIRTGKVLSEKLTK